jgi:hypothetical protein
MGCPLLSGEKEGRPRAGARAECFSASRRAERREAGDESPAGRP